MFKSEGDRIAPCHDRMDGVGLTTRRAMLGVAAAPFCKGRVSGQSEIIALSATWLAIDDEMDREMARWARLETRAGEAHGYFQPSPLDPEMDAIDGRIRQLGGERRRQLKALGGMKPASIHEVAAQLALASRILRDADNEAGPLVREAAAYLARCCCSGCGASYMPAELASSALS